MKINIHILANSFLTVFLLLLQSFRLKCGFRFKSNLKEIEKKGRI